MTNDLAARRLEHPKLCVSIHIHATGTGSRSGVDFYWGQDCGGLLTQASLHFPLGSGEPQHLLSPAGQRGWQTVEFGTHPEGQPELVVGVEQQRWPVGQPAEAMLMREQTELSPALRVTLPVESHGPTNRVVIRPGEVCCSDIV